MGPPELCGACQWLVGFLELARRKTEGCPKPSIAMLKNQHFHYGLGQSWIAGLHTAFGQQSGRGKQGPPPAPAFNHENICKARSQRRVPGKAGLEVFKAAGASVGSAETPTTTKLGFQQGLCHRRSHTQRGFGGPRKRGVAGDQKTFCGRRAAAQGERGAQGARGRKGRGSGGQGARGQEPGSQRGRGQRAKGCGVARHCRPRLPGGFTLPHRPVETLGRGPRSKPRAPM